MCVDSMALVLVHLERRKGDWHGAERASQQTIGTGSKEGKGLSPGRLADSLGL